MSITEDPRTWNGALVRNTEGVVLGQVSGVYFHDRSGRATWAAVTDASGTALVPLDYATVDGHGLRVPYQVQQLATAPRHDMNRHLDPEAEQDLYRHYGLASADSDLPMTPATSGEVASADRPVEMVRSQEQLRVGVQRRVYGRVRLVTYLVTENMTFTVPVSRQEVRLEPVPVDETDPPDPQLPIGELVEDVHEVVLHREEVRFTTTVVRSERVRLIRRVVTRQQPITTQLRHEQIELDHVLTADSVDAETPVRGIAVSSPPPSDTADPPRSGP